MVRYGFSRVDSNGDIVSVWNFGEWGRALTDMPSDEEGDSDSISATGVSESGSHTVVHSDGDFRTPARYSPCPVCALELSAYHWTIFRSVFSSVLSYVTSESGPGCVDDSFLYDFWTHFLCRYVADELPPLEAPHEHADAIFLIQSSPEEEAGLSLESVLGGNDEFDREIPSRRYPVAVPLSQLVTEFVLHLAVTKATCLVRGVPVEDNLELFELTVEVWFRTSMRKQ